MKTAHALLFLWFTATVLGGLWCGPLKSDPCAEAACPAGYMCDPSAGVCKAAGAIQADAGAPSPAARQCLTACTGDRPVCDLLDLTCKVCTVGRGCSGPRPYCDLATPNRRCVECRISADCPNKGTCDPGTGSCQLPPEDAGLDSGEAFSTDSGDDDAGAGPITDAGTADASVVVDGGIAGCIHPDAGMVPCVGECPSGFTCAGGQCVLRGGAGSVQVTLRWDQPEDLDLHVDEPLPGGGACEIWYGDPNNPPASSNCGAEGSLDLDSNAGCAIDGVNIENVIYPAGLAPSGTYRVRVDYFQRCAATSAVPYLVEVRANGTTLGYCGSFQPSDEDMGGAGAGVPVMTFQVP